MTRFIPYEKLSKKEKKKRDLEKRRDWGRMSPVTRVVRSKKAYSRKGRQAGKDVPDGGAVLLHALETQLPGKLQRVKKGVENIRHMY